MMLSTVIVLFTRDLRVSDNPALDLACRSARHVVPLFVLHDGLGFAVPNRVRFLHDCLADLRASLRERGGELVIRRGDPVGEALRLADETGTDGLVLAGDVSAYARRRWQRLDQGCRERRMALRAVDSVTVVPPGSLTPAGGDHFKVFTPYWRAWTGQEWRHRAAVPEKVSVPPGIQVGDLPGLASLGAAHTTARLPEGGESAARHRMGRWLSTGLDGYAAGHDDLPGDATSRLSTDLHFGCLSPLELAARARAVGGDGAEAYVRQLCWRDFHAQVTAAFPDLPRRDYRPRRDGWRDDPDAVEAWKADQTGYPIVDAGMRQMAAEGFMHNRARLLTAPFLPKLVTTLAEGYGPDQVIMCAPPASPSAFVPPPCKGNNPKVAVPGGPHGMYVWNPNHRSAAYQSALANDVIGKDPTLCGASLVIYWSDVEATKGVFDWSSVTAAAKPYTDAGLTVNLLFSDVTEGLVNTVTPAWVTDPVSKGGAGVPTVSCAGQPSIPVYFNAGYEAAWGAFIAAAVHQFSFSNSALAASVGYMRFATAGGAEALPPPGYNDGAACEALWTAAGERQQHDAIELHDVGVLSHCSMNTCDNCSRSASMPVRIRVLTVPSGSLKRSASSVWVSPRK